MKLRIMHTNDLHSSYDAFLKVSSCLKSNREEHTIVLDAGDMIDRKNIMISGSDGLAGVRLLEEAEYDAIAIGNNEGFSPSLLRMAENSKVPFVCCNIFGINGEELPIKKSIIKEYGGVRVLIIGNSVDGSDSYNEFFAFTNLKTSNYIECVRKEIERNKGQYDICIVLSHAGLENDKKMAIAINDIDVIIGGHSHSVMNEAEVINHTVIHQAGKYGEYVGIVDLDIDTNMEIVSVDSKLIETSTEDEDENLKQVMLECRNQAIEALSVPLCTINSCLWHDVVMENPITNLLADGLFDLHDDVDLAIINSGVLNFGLDKGDVSELQLIGCSPSPLNPTRYHIKGKAIREALTTSLDFEHCLRNGRASGFRGYYVGNLQVSYNVRVEYEGRTIKAIYINGKELVDDEIYYVISSDYLQRGSGYPSLFGEDYVYDNYEIRDILRMYLPKNEFVERSVLKRFNKHNSRNIK